MIKLNCQVCGREILTYPSWIKGGKSKYCSRACQIPNTNKALEASGMRTRFSKGQRPWNRRDFILTMAGQGRKPYKLIYNPNHPLSTAKGYVREHRLVMEKYLGRTLLASEVVHHKDGNTMNNDVTNLEILTMKEHCRLHTKDNVHRRWINYTPRGNHIKANN